MSLGCRALLGAAQASSINSFRHLELPRCELIFAAGLAHPVEDYVEPKYRPNVRQHWKGRQLAASGRSDLGKSCLAAGHYGDYLGFSGAPSRSLILSWDGSLWSIDPTQPVGLEDRLYGVARAEGFCHHIKKEPITEMLIARDGAD